MYRNFAKLHSPIWMNVTLIPSILRIYGKTSEEACINLIKLLRKTKGMLFWSDASSWFASLPDGLFHVVNIDQKTLLAALIRKTLSRQ